MKRHLFLFSPLTIGISIFLFSCGSSDKPVEKTANTIGYDKSNMDTTFKPGDDFFMYANNGWLKKTKVPASEGSWGMFSLLKDEVNDKLKKIAEESAAAKDPAKGSI